MIFGLVGPTCVGKTSVSIALADAIDAEIVSVDSRQIYREITIGTAKPSSEELSAVPHHFIDERSIADPVTAPEFAEAARARLADIESRGKRALLVGGSTLYLHALLFGMDDVPPSDPEIRTGLQRRLDLEGLQSLVDELERVDPQAHATMDRANPRRVLRALEVYHATGKPLTSFQSGTDLGPAPFARIRVLNRERGNLYERINERSAAMVQSGLVDEVKKILEAGFDPSLQALQTIGYKEAIQFLSGSIGLERMVELIQRNTRRYAKRQLTWFRRYDAFKWIDVGAHETPEVVASVILERMRLD